MDYDKITEAHNKAWERVGERDLRDVEPDLAHEIAVLEEENYVVLGEMARCNHGGDAMKLLRPGRIGRILLDRHYELKGAKSAEQKESLVQELIKRDLHGFLWAGHGTPEESLNGAESYWISECYKNVHGIMVRAEQLLKRGALDEATKDLAYRGIF
jgi:hypothetical protein